ncbi:MULTISPECIES: type II secretion system F family protein [unclassified Nocardioides]|uniref:type II secretion system F family protein n=1 Tax=unclassified Nocardioides TaxID=2615069 RepID=UPI0006FDF79E|nr:MULTISPECIES: type II secretion system F family protein [unclassified Nocardioides]KQY63508.1 pilus assembly protein TadB [Nocardioides sp. Root140]KRF17541.1 pilus assembly protein TadB [Nocardioides sp. Soil796]
MTDLVVWGAVLGGVAAAGLLLVVSRLMRLRRADLSVRVLPYIRDLPQSGPVRPVNDQTGVVRGVFGPALRSAADAVEKVLGGSTSVRRRLERADIDKTVHEFRIDQVMWGLAAFGAAAAVSFLQAWRSPGNTVSLVVLTLVAFACGVILCDNHLSSLARKREQLILLEFPVVAELLALAVAAGESPVSALDRVVRRTNGALTSDLSKVLAEIRTGTPVGRAFDGLAARTGLPLVSRFAEGIAVAVERGTPLADVLHAQASDVREAGRRELIETGARKEVMMMVPVVFLVLPVTVVFAFWPGLIGLRLVAP